MAREYENFAICLELERVESDLPTGVDDLDLWTAEIGG